MRSISASTCAISCSAWGESMTLLSSASAASAPSTTATTTTATAASATGNDQAQSPNVETAAAATTQPTRKPQSRYRDLFRRPASSAINGRRFDNASISDRTVLVKFPVITAVEIAPGMAKRSSAY